MATTDARSGFRLPWSSDRQTETETEASSQASAVETTSTEVAPIDAPEAVAAPDTTADHGVPEPAAEVTSGASADPVPESDRVETPEPTEAPAPRTSFAPADTTPKPPARKPNKFLADLTKAMQAAAEDARGRALAQLQADAKTHVESIHGRSSGEAAGLRRQADDDVAAIREWSKAEIARIREETEVRITDRKAQLEAEIENHAAVIEREIDAVQRMVSAFEDEMGVFFERLLVEDDPTRFATMAENLPEPPTFEDISAAVGLPVETPVSDVLADSAAGDEAIADAVDAVAVESAVDTRAHETMDATADVTAEAPATESVPTDATLADDAAGAFDADENGGPVETATELATESIATEADAMTELATPTDEASSSSDASPVAASDDAAPIGEVDAEAALAATERAADAATNAEPGDDASAGTAEATDVGIEVVGALDDQHAADPRFAALGLSPDYDAAEAEALAAADAADAEEIPTIADDALAARIAGLVPAGDAAAQSETASTQVVVVGLVSVASIASFKRHLGRVAGVQSVGVSSGPDGEFVFAVTHATDANLRDAIPSLPSFQARVTSSTDGAINVTAHDPEADG
jgi:trimeric autotransporter adhesin